MPTTTRTLSPMLSLQDFHPNNFQNQKKVWIAQQKAAADKKIEKERHKEMQSEQSIHNAKGFALMTKHESEQAKQRHSVGFMYDAPAGVKESAERGSMGDAPLKLELDDGHTKKVLSLEEKFKFMKGAPIAPGVPHGTELTNQPFGETQRNVKCKRCGEWGHQTQDTICKLFGVNKVGEGEEAEREAFEDPATLMKNMQHETGLALTQRVLGRRNDTAAANQQLLIEEPADEDAEFLASLSSKEKRKLLKSLEAKLDTGSTSKKSSKSKKEEKKKKKKKKKRSSSSKSKHHRHHHGDGSSSSDSDDADGGTNTNEGGNASHPPPTAPPAGPPPAIPTPATTTAGVAPMHSSDTDAPGRKRDREEARDAHSQKQPRHGTSIDRRRDDRRHRDRDQGEDREDRGRRSTGYDRRSSGEGRRDDYRPHGSDPKERDGRARREEAFNRRLAAEADGEFRRNMNRGVGSLPC
jgi:CBF1 interacting corepressor